MADVTIPEPFIGGPGALCAPSTITGQWLCGEGLAKGDHYIDKPVDLVSGDSVKLITEVIIRIIPADVLPLELDGDEVDVNPVLMPVVCEPLEAQPLDCVEA